MSDAQMEVPSEYRCSLCESNFSSEKLCSEHIKKCALMLSENTTSIEYVVDETECDITIASNAESSINLQKSFSSVPLQDPLNKIFGFISENNISSTSEGTPEDEELSFIDYIDFQGPSDSDDSFLEFPCDKQNENREVNKKAGLLNENNTSVNIISVNPADEFTNLSVNNENSIIIEQQSAEKSCNNIKTLAVLNPMVNGRTENELNNNSSSETADTKTQVATSSHKGLKNNSHCLQKVKDKTPKPKKAGIDIEIVKDIDPKSIYRKIQKPVQQVVRKKDQYSVFEFYDEEEEQKKLEKERERQKLREIKERTCMYCSKVFKDPMDVLRHKRTAHPTPEKIILSDADLKPYLKLKNQKHCPLCNKVLYPLCYRSVYLKHMLIHSDPKFVCKICGMKFKRIDYLKNHEVRHIVTVTSKPD